MGCDLLVVAEPEYEKQITGFQKVVSKYAKCTEVKYLNDSGKFGFLVYPHIEELIYKGEN